MKLLKLPITLAMICSWSSLYAQIHVGPKNNVGVRTIEDSTISMQVLNGGDELTQYPTNFFSLSNIDSLIETYNRNVHIETTVNDRDDIFPSNVTIGAELNYRQNALGLFDVRRGIDSRTIESTSIESNIGPYTQVTGLYNYVSSRTNSSHYGIWNRLDHSSGNSGFRCGIYNYVTRSGPAYSNEDQYGIYNSLFAADSEFPPTALYSTVTSSHPTAYAGYFNGDVVVTGTFTPLGSDSLLKKNISPITYGLDDILAMNPVEFEYKESTPHNLPSGTHLGVIAQEMEMIIPEVVNNTPYLDPRKDEYTFDENGNQLSHNIINGEYTEYKTVAYMEIIPILIKAIQEQQVMIEALEQQIGGLQKNNPKGK